MASLRLHHRVDVKRSCEWALLTGLILLPAWAQGVDVEQRPPAAQKMEQRIAQEVEAARVQEQRGMEPLKLGRLWAQLASDYEDEMQYAKSELAYNRALRYLETSPGRIDYAIVLGNLGSLYVLAGDFAAAERCRRQSLAVREELGDRLQIARGRMNLAEAELAQRKYKDAERDSREAYNEMVALKDPDMTDVVSTLTMRVYAECNRGGCANGVEDARTAWTLAHRAFADRSLPIAMAHLALGFSEWKTGVKDGPDAEMRAGIETMRALMPMGHPYVLGALEQYGAYLKSVNRGQEAQRIAAEIAQIKGGVRTDCADCTVSVYGLR